jgi:5-formyltetrahydrofolate cyclo-ligase
MIDSNVPAISPLDPDAARARLRAHHLALRRATTRAERAALSARVVGHLAGHPWVCAAGTLAAFMGVGGEPVLGEALSALGCRIALPRTTPEGLRFHLWDGGALHAGQLGVPEPDAALPPVLPGEIDLWLIPGVVFDRAGNRLGRGKGHYDRALAGLTSRRVGVTFAAHIVDAVPAAAHDVPMHALLTEEGWLNLLG